MVGENLHKSILQVTHHELTPMDDRPNKWASICPACNKGTLGVRRHPETFRLEVHDLCTLCGQLIEYKDIEDMRNKDWA